MVYCGSNVAEVFQVEKLIYVSYRMTLPLYEEFKAHRFVLNSRSGLGLNQIQLVRTYMKGTLALLMEKDGSTQLLVYGLNFT